MPNSIERIPGATLTAPFHCGQILIRPSSDGFVLTHHDDELLERLQTFRDEEDAIEIAKYDDAGHYRPLKTAPNMRHGWRLDLATAGRIEMRAGLFLSRPARGIRGVEKREPANDVVARYAGAAIGHVSRCGAEFPMHKSTTLSRIFVDLMADASGRFCGNAIGAEQSLRRSCRRTSLIRQVIRFQL